MTQLATILATLSLGSTESVQNGQNFGDLDKYLHIKRGIENSLCAKMDALDAEGGGLILLVGSAGDGKSHLISSVRNRGRYQAFYFYNDATESYSPTKTAIDTLKEVLVDYADKNIDVTSKKLVLAINIGKLNAFLEDESVKKTYGKLIDFIAPLFSEKVETITDKSRLKLVCFANQQIFELHKDESTEYPVDSSFLNEFLRRITIQDKTNPFYRAYKESLPLDCSKVEPVILNYQLLCMSEVQNTIVKLVIEAIVRFKLMVTPRDFQDFVYSILVPEQTSEGRVGRLLLNGLMPTMLFCGSRSKIQQYMAMLDPLKYSSTEHDKELADLFTSPMIPENFLDEGTLEVAVPMLLENVRKLYGNNRKNVMYTTQFLFRLKHLLTYHSESKEYVSFLQLLKGFMNNDGQEIQRVYQMVNTVIPRHYGSYYSPENTVPLNIQGRRHRLFASINISPDKPTCVYKSLNEFSLAVILGWKVQGHNIPLVVDFQLYEYLVRLNDGKLSLNIESDKNMVFSHFIRQLVELSDSSQEVIIMTSDNKRYKLSNQFGIISYRLC